MESMSIQRFNTKKLQDRWVLVSLNYSARSNKNPYDEKGRYGFRKSKNPYNVDKYEWYSRAYEDQRAKHINSIRKGVYNA